MVYAKQTWVDNTTPVDAAHMNHIEDGIFTVEGEIPAASRLVPTPVVNGQWIKGVGGAAVWAPLATADIDPILPARLAPSGTPAVPTGNDLNNATLPGWYQARNDGAGTANRPAAIWAAVHVVGLDGGTAIWQFCYEHATVRQWQRQYLGSGSWSSWSRLIPAAVVGSVTAAGGIRSGTGFTVAHPSGGNYTITLATPIGNPIAIISPLGQSTVGGGYASSSTTVLAFMTTPGAWVDSDFNFAVWNAA